MGFFGYLFGTQKITRKYKHAYKNIENFYEYDPQYVTDKNNADNEERKKLNEEALELIDEVKGRAIKEVQQQIFNMYSGMGHLIVLSYEDDDKKKPKSLNQILQERREEELQQFFTPDPLAKFMVEFLEIEDKTKVIDFSCGMGNLFNWLENKNICGIEIDESAYKIAKYLFPDADIRLGSMERNPFLDIDYVLGNPPFSIMMDYSEKEDIDGYLSTLIRNSKKLYSQDLYLYNTWKSLKAGGYAILLTSASWLSDGTKDKKPIQFLNKFFEVVAEISLPRSTFKTVDIKNFPVKLMVIQKTHEGIKNYTNIYKYDVKSFNQLNLALQDFRNSKNYQDFRQHKTDAKIFQHRHRYNWYFNIKLAENQEKNEFRKVWFKYQNAKSLITQYNNRLKNLKRLVKGGKIEYKDELDFLKSIILNIKHDELARLKKDIFDSICCEIDEKIYDTDISKMKTKRRNLLLEKLGMRPVDLNHYKKGTLINSYGLSKEIKNEIITYYDKKPNVSGNGLYNGLAERYYLNIPYSIERKQHEEWWYGHKPTFKKTLVSINNLMKNLYEQHLIKIIKTNQVIRIKPYSPLALKWLKQQGITKEYRTYPLHFLRIRQKNEVQELFVSTMKDLDEGLRVFSNNEVSEDIEIKHDFNVWKYIERQCKRFDLLRFPVQDINYNDAYPRPIYAYKARKIYGNKVSQHAEDISLRYKKCLAEVEKVTNKSHYPLFDYQKEDLAKVLTRGGTAFINYDTGTGKMPFFLNWVQHQKGQVVLTTMRLLIKQFTEEIEKFFPNLSYTIIDKPSELIDEVAKWRAYYHRDEEALQVYTDRYVDQISTTKEKVIVYAPPKIKTKINEKTKEKVVVRDKNGQVVYEQGDVLFEYKTDKKENYKYSILDRIKQKIGLGKRWTKVDDETKLKPHKILVFAYNDFKQFNDLYSQQKLLAPNIWIEKKEKELERLVLKSGKKKVPNLRQTKREWMKLFKREIRRGTIKGMVMDESWTAKNSTSKIHQAVNQLFHAVPKRMLLNATICDNNITELYNQWKILLGRMNSLNLCEVQTLYYTRNEEQKPKENTKYLSTFGFRGCIGSGMSLFRECFFPTKTTVFDMDKTNQGVINANILLPYVKQLRIRRSFQEAFKLKWGDLPKTTHETRLININDKEKAVYLYIATVYKQLMEAYYNSEGEREEYDRTEQQIETQQSFKLRIAKMIAIGQLIMAMQRATSCWWDALKMEIKRINVKNLDLLSEGEKQSFDTFNRVINELNKDIKDLRERYWNDIKTDKKKILFGSKMEQIKKDLLLFYNNPKNKGKKIIICSNFHPSTQELKPYLLQGDDICRENNFNIIEIPTGTADMSKRNEIINKFKNDKDIQILISTIGMLKAGLNIGVADEWWQMDLPYNPTILQQATARIIRITSEKGNKKPTPKTVKYYLGKQTFDTNMVKLITRKLSLQKFVQDDMLRDAEDLERESLGISEDLSGGAKKEYYKDAKGNTRVKYVVDVPGITSKHTSDWGESQIEMSEEYQEQEQEEQAKEEKQVEEKETGYSIKEILKKLPIENKNVDELINAFTEGKLLEIVWKLNELIISLSFIWTSKEFQIQVTNNKERKGYAKYKQNNNNKHYFIYSYFLYSNHRRYIKGSDEDFDVSKFDKAINHFIEQYQSLETIFNWHEYIKHPEKQQKKKVTKDTEIVNKQKDQLKLKMLLRKKMKQRVKAKLIQKQRLLKIR